MNIIQLIKDVFKPAADLVDNVHTSTEEKMTLKNAFETIQNTFHSMVIEYETKLLAAKTSIITAEAGGQSWMQRNWRPITMLTFLLLVVMDSFGWLPNPLAKEAWDLLKIGLGGYVVGRSIEKTAKTIKSN